MTSVDVKSKTESVCNIHTDMNSLVAKTNIEQLNICVWNINGLPVWKQGHNKFIHAINSCHITVLTLYNPDAEMSYNLYYSRSN